MGKHHFLTDAVDAHQSKRRSRAIFVDQAPPYFYLNGVGGRGWVPSRTRLRPQHDVRPLRMFNQQIHQAVTISLNPTCPFPRSTQNLTLVPTVTASVPVATCPTPSVATSVTSTPLVASYTCTIPLATGVTVPSSLSIRTSNPEYPELGIDSLSS